MEMINCDSSLESTPMLDGVCCEYCAKIETPACPVQTASPWNRWKDFCGEYTPNLNEPSALTIEEAVKRTASNELSSGARP